jgi:hypothetical protein
MLWQCTLICHKGKQVPSQAGNVLKVRADLDSVASLNVPNLYKTYTEADIPSHDLFFSVPRYSIRV